GRARAARPRARRAELGLCAAHARAGRRACAAAREEDVPARAQPRVRAGGEAARRDQRAAAARPRLAAPRRAGRLAVAYRRGLGYCETVKNITVSLPDDVYRRARMKAAE